MQSLGAALIVCIILIVVVLVAMAALAPTFERIKYYDMQMQLSRERTAHGDNLTTIIIGGLFCLALVVGGGLILYFNHRADAMAYQYELRRLEAEAERDRVKLLAYREALRRNGDPYAMQLPEGGRVISNNWPT